MKLLIDTGNSRIKWATLSNGEIQPAGQANTREATQTLGSLWNELQTPDEIWASNVAGEAVAAAIITHAQSNWAITPHFVAVEAHSYGISNGYPLPSQLGVDRWVAMIGAWSLTKAACCVVDCGTAVTLDVLDDSGQHQGGIIYPGLQTMLRSLSSNTHALPEVTETPEALLANNTRAGIATGCHRAVEACINQTVASAIQRYGRMQCLITGGDAGVIRAGLHADFIHKPELVLQGLAVYAGGGE